MCRLGDGVDARRARGTAAALAVSLASEGEALVRAAALAFGDSGCWWVAKKTISVVVAVPAAGAGSGLVVAGAGEAEAEAEAMVAGARRRRR